MQDTQNRQPAPAWQRATASAVCIAIVMTGRERGELSDQALKLLLRARAFVTSRFPLVDLQDWDMPGLTIGAR